MASGEAKKSRTAVAQVDGLSFGRVSVVATPPSQRSVPCDRIIVEGRLRPTESQTVANLAVSIGEQGQITPILIRPIPGPDGGLWWKLVAGAHRLEAIRDVLGWETILVDIRHLTDAEARLVEIDENLIRRNLTPYERAINIQARLGAWAVVHPDRVVPLAEGVDYIEPAAPKRGRPKNSEKFSEFLGDTPVTMGFATETAADLGISDKTVRNALAIARGLSAPVHAVVAGSKLGKNEGLLRQVSGVSDPAEQLAVVEALLSEKAKTFSDALVVATGRAPVQAPPRPVDETVAQFRKLWKGAKPTHRAALLDFLVGQTLPAGWVLTKGDANG